MKSQLVTLLNIIYKPYKLQLIVHLSNIMNFVIHIEVTLYIEYLLFVLVFLVLFVYQLIVMFI